jgi:RNA polymerase sigma-70 factor, ECF subfamily
MNSGREDEAELQRTVAELRAGVRVEANSRRIFERFYPWVHRFFGRFGYTAEDSEDLTQETFSQVFHRIGSFREESSFKSWLFAVAANNHRNERRRRHRQKRDAQEVSIDAAADSAAPTIEPVATEDSPVQVVYGQERRQALSRAIKELPPQMRHVLALRIDQDLKYREIAAVLQISVETVKAHLFQARQRLRTELGEELGEWVD